MLNICYTVRNSYIFKAGATPEGIRINTNHAVTDSYTFKASALLEGSSANSRHVVRNGYTLKVSAPVKCELANTRHAIWNNKCLKARLTTDGRFVNRGYWKILICIGQNNGLIVTRTNPLNYISCF